MQLGDRVTLAKAHQPGQGPGSEGRQGSLYPVRPAIPPLVHMPRSALMDQA